MTSDSQSAQAREAKRALMTQLLDTSRDSAEVFAPFLADRDRWVRSDAIDILLKSKLGAAGRLIAPRIDDPDDMIRSDAIEAIGILRYTPAIPQLIVRMQTDRIPLVRTCAAEAIGDIGERSDDAVVALLNAMDQDTNELVRAYAADSLGRMGVSLARSCINAQCQRDRSARARASMLQSLYRLGDEDALKELLRMLRRVRRWEMEAAILNMLKEIMTSENQNLIEAGLRGVANAKPSFESDHHVDMNLFGFEFVSSDR